MQPLRNQQILLTGASGGIGNALARLLHSSGARVFITGKNPDKLSQCGNEAGIRPEMQFAADLSNNQEVQQLKQHFFEQCTQIDTLINLAGTGIIHPIEQLTESDLDRSLKDNLYSAFHLMQAFLPEMKKTGTGLIIHTPGILGKVPMAGAAAYCASKYALVGLMQSIREELKRSSIRITQVYLGGTDSAFWDTIDLKVQRDKMVRTEEAAKAIWFLCQQPDSGVINELVLQPFNHQAI